MNRQVFFELFRDALAFMKLVKVGMIQRTSDERGYVWDSESAYLTEDQKELVADADGSKLIWDDAETGLSWLFGPDRCRGANWMHFGGHTDWRLPTLRELIALGSSKKNGSGVYVKNGLEGKISGIYASSTRLHSPGGQPALWSFDARRIEYEDCSESEIVWDEEGEYSGMSSVRRSSPAKIIMVRGIELPPKADWVLKLRDWSASENMHTFPSTQRGMEEMESLSLRATRLPMEVKNLIGLRHLSCCPFKNILPAVFSITGLEELNFQWPELSHRREDEPLMDEIPAEIKNLTELVTLNVATGIREISEEIGGLKNLQNLSLRKMSPDPYPASIKNLTELRTLSISAKLEADFQEFIGSLGRLESLEIYGQLARLPDSISGMKSLKELRINSSERIELPSCIGELKCLKALHISAPIEWLPSEIGNLNSLEVLEVLKANLKVFPEFLPRMPNLKRLSLADSPIHEIPESINEMRGLSYLSLNGTKISGLPKSILLLPNLKHLAVCGTLIISPLDWLAERFPKRTTVPGCLFWG